MTLRDFLDEAGLMPEVAGITGPLDGWRRDDLLSRFQTYSWPWSVEFPFAGDRRKAKL
jgi:hypothetical protein